MVESLDHPHCLFVILGLQFRGKNDNVRNVSFGQVSTERLWSFSNASAPEDRTLNNPPELPLNLSGSWFLNPEHTDWEYPKQNWSRQETAEEPRAPQQSVPAEYFSPDTILFQKYMALICYVKLTLYRNRLKKKIKPQRKCTTQSQVLEINYLPIPEIMILAGVLSLVSLK